MFIGDILVAQGLVSPADVRAKAVPSSNAPTVNDVGPPFRMPSAPDQCQNNCDTEREALDAETTDRHAHECHTSRE